MEKKTKKYIKNVILSNLAGIGGGVLGSMSTDLFTDSKGAIATSSTVAQYIASYGAFFPLHARDNQDLYGSQINEFKWRDFGRDILKYEAAVSLLQYAYILGRPIVQYQFQKRGMDPATSSIAADAVCIPIYYALAIPAAKITGLLREMRENNV